MMEVDRKIGIITVVYNGAKFIEETIRSVIGQSYQQIEYIIIDGGSDDDTLSIIKKYEDKITIWKSEPDNGIYDAMNKGINLAQSDWLLFLNAGDTFFTDNTLALVANQLVECDVLYGKTQIVDLKKGKYIRSYYPQRLDWKVIPYCHQSVFIKRHLLKRTLFDLKFKIAADYDQYFRLKKQNVVFRSIEEVISNYDNSGYSMINYSCLLNEYHQIALMNYVTIVSKLKINVYFLLKKILSKR